MARRRPRRRRDAFSHPLASGNEPQGTLAVRFKRRLLRPYPLLLACVLVLAAGGVGLLLHERVSQHHEAVWVDPSRVGPERTLSLTAEILGEGDQAVLRLAGETNFPDGVALELTVTALRETCVRERAVVQNAAFELRVPAAGKRIEAGSYEVAATFDLYAQSEPTREELHYQPRRLVESTTLTVEGDSSGTEAFVREQLQLLHSIYAGTLQSRAVALAEVRTARSLVQARRGSLFVSRLTPALADLQRLADELEAHFTAAPGVEGLELAARRRRVEELIARVHVEANL